MHYAFQHQTTHYPFLMVSGRKRAIKHHFIVVEQGHLLLRLGAKEYLIQAKDVIWIPFDCLHALTCLPDTTIVHIEISARVNAEFPTQAGLVTMSPLCQAIVQRIKDCTREASVYTHLMGILSDEIQHCSPRLTDNLMTARLQRWHQTLTTPEQFPVDGLSPELHLALLIREAEKRRLSGSSASAIADQLFEGKETHYQQLRVMLLGSDAGER